MTMHGVSGTDREDPPLRGRRVLLVGRAGARPVIQPMDMLGLSSEEQRFFGAAAPVFVEWLEELERASAAGVQTDEAVMAAWLTELSRCAAAVAPTSADEFREYAMAEAQPLIHRLYDLLFSGSYALAGHDLVRFVVFVSDLEAAIKSGAVVLSPSAQRRAQEAVAVGAARADSRFQALLANLVGSSEPGAGSP